MVTATTAVVVAIIAAVASLGGAITVEVSRRRAASASERRRAAEVMAAYRNPLLRSAYDLQSRLYNVWRGYRGRRDGDYYRASTLFVVAELLGWMEIVRREVQFLDLSDDRARRVQERVDRIRDTLAETSARRGAGDGLYLYRVEQRAIGELMIVDNPARTGPAQACLGYAGFVGRLADDPAFARWFARFGDAIEAMPADVPPRVVALQHALVDLIEALDPGGTRVGGPRGRIPG